MNCFCNWVQANICWRCITRYWSGAGRTKMAVDPSLPISWVNFRIKTDNLLRRSWPCFNIWFFSSCERNIVVSIEYTSTPKSCMVWHGSSTDYSYWSENLNSEKGKWDCPVPMSNPQPRPPSAKYCPEKLSIEHSASPSEKWGSWVDL